MDEGQAKRPYYNLQWLYNGILEVSLDMEAHMPSATQNSPKRAKRNHQRRRNILNHNGQKVNLQLNT